MTLILGGVNYNRGYTQPIPPPLQWVDLTPHPKVIDQPQESVGRVIRSLTPYAEKILIGYGDYGLNTGPMAVAGYDSLSGEPVTLLDPVPSEALWRNKVYDGSVYSPWIDPTWYYGPGGYTTNESGSWTNVEVGDMVHTFDVAKFKGKLILAGSHLADQVNDIANGCVWTQDADPDGPWNGWLHSYAHPSSSRCYRLVEREGKLWTRVVNFDTGVIEATVSTTDGINWAPDTWLTTYGNLDEWGELFSIQRQHPLPTFGTRVSVSIVADGWVWAGREDGTVARAALPGQTNG